MSIFCCFLPKNEEGRKSLITLSSHCHLFPPVIFCSYEMPLLYQGVPVELGLMSSASSITPSTTSSTSSSLSLYLYPREFAITHANDSSVRVLRADLMRNSVLILLRHSGSGVLGLCHVDHDCDVERFLNRFDTLTAAHFEAGGTQLQIAAFKSLKGEENVTKILSTYGTWYKKHLFNEWIRLTF